MKKPKWLPEKLDRGIYDKWIDFEDALYEIFTQDILNKQNLKYRDKPIVINQDIDRSKPKNREKGFYHLVKKTVTKRSKRSIEDAKRAEKIGWIKQIILNCSDPAIKEFDYYEGGGIIRSYLWLKDQKYVVILEPQNGHYFLVTAYHVDYEKTLQKKYENRLK